MDWNVGSWFLHGLDWNGGSCIWTDGNGLEWCKLVCPVGMMEVCIGLTEID
jgi:hypothetical protein